MKSWKILPVFVFVLVLSLLCTACSDDAIPVPSSSNSDSGSGESQIHTEELTPTDAPESISTNTPEPSNTPTPSINFTYPNADGTTVINDDACNITGNNCHINVIGTATYLPVNSHICVLIVFGGNTDFWVGGNTPVTNLFPDNHWEQSSVGIGSRSAPPDATLFMTAYLVDTSLSCKNIEQNIETGIEFESIAMAKTAFKREK